MPAAYLTPTQVRDRLAAFDIVSTPPAGMCAIASDDLDGKGGFIGFKLVETQHREFPRDITVQDDTPGAVPERILDWVALRAYQLTEDDDAPVIIESVDKLMVRYGGKGKKSTHSRLMRNLLRFYREPGSGRIV